MIEAIDTVIAEERPAGPVAPFKRPYLQHLPDWIYADERYRRLSSAEKYALHTIAGRGDRHVLTGSILDCFCGEGLVREIGSPATFWRRMDKFEQLGFVRTVSRGGGHYANVVAIPGQPGLLDRFQVPRRKQRCGAGGMTPAPYVRGSVAAKLTLAMPLPSQDERASVSKRGDHRLNLRHSHRLPIPLSIPTIHPAAPMMLLLGIMGKEKRTPSLDNPKCKSVRTIVGVPFSRNSSGRALADPTSPKSPNAPT